MKLDQVRMLDFPKILDARGNLTFIQENDHIPFDIKRAYWIYDVPGGEVRGGHAYHELNEVIIALSGSFDVVIDDGEAKKIISLNRSYYGVLVPKKLWRRLENFSTNSLALIVGDRPFSEEDYIRDYEKFKELNRE